MAAIRILLLSIALAALSWFAFLHEAPAYGLAQGLIDIFDSRPARRVLFVGNSRMAYNDLPTMVRRMADSASSSHKLKVEMWAPPGRTLEEHWREGEVQALLNNKAWDQLIFQAASGEQWDETLSTSFHLHGRMFAELANERDVSAAMIVGWTYGPSAFVRANIDAETYHRWIQDDHSKLGQVTKISMVNVGRVWRGLTVGRAPVRLMSDGNHPTVQGSYLSALMVYAYLAGTNGSEVRWVADGMTDEEAGVVQAAVKAYYDGQPQRETLNN